jgi:hypothetical protein
MDSKFEIKKGLEAQTESVDMKMLRSVAGYTRETN